MMQQNTINSSAPPTESNCNPGLVPPPYSINVQQKESPPPYFSIVNQQVPIVNNPNPGPTYNQHYPARSYFNNRLPPNQAARIYCIILFAVKITVMIVILLFWFLKV